MGFAPLPGTPEFHQVMGPPLFKGEGGSLATHLRHLILVRRDVFSLNKAIYVALGLLVHPSEQESSTTHTYLQFYSFTCRSFWYHWMRNEEEDRMHSLPAKTDGSGVKESLETLPHSKPFNFEKRKAAVRAQERAGFLRPFWSRIFYAPARRSRAQWTLAVIGADNRALGGQGADGGVISHPPPLL